MTAAATSPGASRRRPSNGRAAKAMTAAAHSIVRCVPISGMATSAAKKVPRMLPAVESAKMRPATRPASATPVAASLTANGVTMPSSTTGGANSASAAANEPSTAPVETVSMPAHREVEERPRHEGHRGDERRRGDDDRRQKRRGRAPVGEPAAEPVAQRQRREDQADDVGPHGGGRPVVGRQQS